MIKTKYILTTISCGLLVLASAESIKVEKQTPIIKSFTKKIKVCKETAWSGNLNQDTFFLIPKQPFDFVTLN
ncbi:MAG: hypothetical protein HOF69_01080 [Campylobacteraceae bacterium]|jgi:hypothetical protein|nr:hypothetical protein [Campylobacteraceae bacterium]MBT4179840.1 hypothetical protein [Campylobacteraceae bacterium]MBT4571804.1 hypothetical protein [Campylobacteraceae bacterium]MBT4707632.1 hypothetical protein [Campylobacteraceae bacterium]MBT6108100.1 hypothetical protein [Campylobacteraceae bacterium]